MKIGLTKLMNERQHRVRLMESEGKEQWKAGGGGG